MNNNLHVYCPNCGLEIEVAENIAGKNIPEAKEGIYTLIPKKQQERINQLANAGIDVSKFLNMGMSISFGTDGTITFNPSRASDEADEIEREISEEGYIDGGWRRWIMAQMFRAINSPNGYFKTYTEYDYFYSWKVLKNELKAQRKLEGEELKIRQLFFNKKTVVDMLVDLSNKIDRIKSSLKKDENFYIPYIGEFSTTELDFEKEIITNAIFEINNNNNAYNIINYCLERVPIARLRLMPSGATAKKATAWKQAFMGAGAYYTLENMIKYHNCLIKETYYTADISGESDENRFYSLEDSLNIITIQAKTCSENNNFYPLYALLRATIEANGYDFVKDMQENAYQRKQRKEKKS